MNYLLLPLILLLCVSCILWLCFAIKSCNCYIFLTNYFIITKCTSLFPVNFFFVLKSILSDICIAIPDLNWFTYLNLISVSYKQHIFGSCFSIQSNNQCSSYGVFNLFTFNVIINMLRLLHAILLFVFYTCHLFFLLPHFSIIVFFLVK